MFGTCLGYLFYLLFGYVFIYIFYRHDLFKSETKKELWLNIGIIVLSLLFWPIWIVLFVLGFNINRLKYGKR